ncbi:unnamed protein product [Lampetra planeri]
MRLCACGSVSPRLRARAASTDAARDERRRMGSTPGPGGHDGARLARGPLLCPLRHSEMAPGSHVTRPALRLMTVCACACVEHTDKDRSPLVYTLQTAGMQHGVVPWRLNELQSSALYPAKVSSWRSLSDESKEARHCITMVFSFVAFCYMLSLVLCSALLFFAVWRIAAYDELWRESNAASDQTDCITKLERERKIEKLCRMLMKLALPEYFIHCLFCVMFLCALEWLALAVNLPLFCYHSWRFMQSPGKQSAADATHDPGTATQAEVLAYCRREGWCKLGFYLLSYFYYLYKCSGVLPLDEHCPRVATNGTAATACTRQDGVAVVFILGDNFIITGVVISAQTSEATDGGRGFCGQRLGSVKLLAARGRLVREMKGHARSSSNVAAVAAGCALVLWSSVARLGGAHRDGGLTRDGAPSVATGGTIVVINTGLSCSLADGDESVDI